MNKQNQRNITIDILRTIGLLLVIAAHCEFPQWFYELREFDVVTLVAISGMSFYLSSGRNEESYAVYVKKRFRRLVLPVWGFLIFFFLFFRLFGRTFTLREIGASFLLLAGGILFIWIYRIFFVNALLNRFLKRLTEKVSFRISLVILVLGLVINELLFRYAGMLLPAAAGKVFEYVVIYTLGYALISWVGMLWEKHGLRERLILLAVSAVLFGITVITGGIHGFYESKYPPQLYYISYGLLWTFALYLLCEKIPVNETAGKIINWLSVNTMRIYMWHIFLYYLLDTLSPVAMHHAWLAYAVLLGGGIIGSLLQGKLMEFVKRR